MVDRHLPIRDITHTHKHSLEEKVNPHNTITHVAGQPRKRSETLLTAGGVNEIDGSDSNTAY